MNYNNGPTENKEPSYTKKDWDTVPESIKTYIKYIKNIVVALFKENKKLKERIDKLEGKANKNSSNSSKPPSSDSPYDRS